VTRARTLDTANTGRKDASEAGALVSVLMKPVHLQKIAIRDSSAMKGSVLWRKRMRKLAEHTQNARDQVYASRVDLEATTI
jgi:hypothetical protein